MKPIELDANSQHLGSFTILDAELEFETQPQAIVHPQGRAKSGHGSPREKKGWWGNEKQLIQDLKCDKTLIEEQNGSHCCLEMHCFQLEMHCSFKG
jgi:hypothetical protein